MRLVVMKLITAALEGQQRDNPQNRDVLQVGFSGVKVCCVSQEYWGDSSRQAVTVGELDRVVDGS